MMGVEHKTSSEAMFLIYDGRYSLGLAFSSEIVPLKFSYTNGFDVILIHVAIGGIMVYVSWFMEDHPI